ncbi:MAG: hypothetical protein LOD90_05155, partial [Symbiobacteriaceae bacterium]
GMECMGYSPFIYAFEQENIAVTGKGTLDGRASTENWWPWKGNDEGGWKKGMPRQHEARKKLEDACDAGVPVEQRIFAEGSYLRPMFIQPYRSKNILIEGVNDGPEEARQLARLLKGTLAHVNLIPMNPVAERPQYRRPGPERVNQFKQILESSGIATTVRREMGGEIDAACGQLRNRAQRAHLRR